MSRRALLTCVALLGACAESGSHPSVVRNEWQVEYQHADGALMSIWGTESGEVWAVGGQAGRGLILERRDGAWQPAPVAAHGLLWWVYGFGRDDVYAVGEQGVALHNDGSGWRPVPVAWGGTPLSDRTLYGLWGASGDDVWAVGGDPNGGQAVVLRGNREGLSPVDGIPAALLPSALFKIYGFTADDVFAVGTAGTVLRWSGGVWTRDEVPTDKALTSLWGRSATDVYAVGGVDQGVVLHYDGTRWGVVDTVEPGPGLFGVFTAPGQPVVAVGGGPRVVEMAGPGRVEEPWVPVESFDTVLHSVWGDGSSALWAVGGSLLSYPAPMNGVVLRLEAR